MFGPEKQLIELLTCSEKNYIILAFFSLQKGLVIWTQAFIIITTTLMPVSTSIRCLKAFGILSSFIVLDHSISKNSNGQLRFLYLKSYRDSSISGCCSQPLIWDSMQVIASRYLFTSWAPTQTKNRKLHEITQPSSTELDVNMVVIDLSDPSMVQGQRMWTPSKKRAFHSDHLSTNTNAFILRWIYTICILVRICMVVV